MLPEMGMGRPTRRDDADEAHGSPVGQAPADYDGSGPRRAGGIYLWPARSRQSASIAQAGPDQPKLLLWRPRAPI